jgi:hypothetical protein
MEIPDDFDFVENQKYSFFIWFECFTFLHKSFIWRDVYNEWVIVV